MKFSLRAHWLPGIALLILWLAIGMLAFLSLRQNQGHLVYALDDPYIHMAMAKNFARYGTWGITRYGFTSSSSSLFWTLILSFLYLIAGVNEAIPFILNILSATVLVLAVYGLTRARRPSPHPAYTLMVLIAIIFLTPLPPLVFSGQEHVLHILVTIIFVFIAAQVLSSDHARCSPSVFYLILSAAFLPLIRYEGLFLVLVVCILFILRRRYLLALAMGVAALVPVTIYGIISINHGWFFLPNSALIKGKSPHLASARGVINFLGYSAAMQFIQAPHMLILTATALAVYLIRTHKGIWERSQIMLLIFIGTTLLHMQFARTGWFYRYEAYLVALGTCAITWALSEYFPRRIPVAPELSTPARTALSILILLSALSLGTRGAQAVKKIPRATTNIYEQQYQMGLFLQRFYQGATVAANDVGAINYLADIRCIDMAGLGNMTVAREMRGGSYTSARVRDLARSEGVMIAALYDLRAAQRGNSLIPPEWMEVGQWKIAHNVVCGNDAVSFYAVQPSAEGPLRENLKSFSSLLPADVAQRGSYLRREECPTADHRFDSPAGMPSTR